MAENGKMADGSFELFYRIFDEKNEYGLHFDVSSHEMAKNGRKWQNGKMAEMAQLAVRAP